MHHRFTVGTVVVLLGIVAGAQSQSPADLEDLRFIRELRERGDADLAMDLLSRLKKSPTPELAKALVLEEARTRLKAAADEPDTTKRLSQYAQAQADFQKYLAANPAAFEVKADLAEVALLRGRTQLSRALLQDTPEGRDAEGAKARDILVQAGALLKQVADELDKQIVAAKDDTPQEKLAKKRLEAERLRIELAIGVNLFDQGQTYSKTHKDDKVLLERGKRMEAAYKVLNKLAGMDNNSPYCWQAAAWAGRCLDETGEPKKARARFTTILEAPPSVAAEGQRLARYFRMLVIKDSPDPAVDKPSPSAILIDAATRWMADYPRHQKTQEAYGVRVLLAEIFTEQSAAAKTPAEKKLGLDKANRLLKEVEATENDFTDRAKKLKIQIIGASGGFTVPVATLDSFDKCFVRAQYEILQIGEDAKKLPPDQRKQAEKSRIQTVIEALDRALTFPEGKKPGLEANNARALFSYYALNSGKYKDAIRVGEEFARTDPRAAQAPMAAIYALESYSQELANREAMGATADELKEEKDRMLKLAQYMEERWPKETAGDVARFQLAAVMLREKNLTDKYPEIIRRLEGVTPSFPGFARAQWELAQVAFQAEREKAPPMPGDKPDGYRTRAMAALERIPEPAAGGDPQAAHLWLLARVRLTRELFKAKKYDLMQTAATNLRTKLPTLRTDADDKRNEAIRNQLSYEIEELLLYARYGLAEAAYAANQFQPVAAMLDPLVKELNEGKLPPMRKNLQLGMALLGMDLKASVQLGQVPQAREVLKALSSLSAEAGAETSANAILGQLSVLIQQQVEDLRKKNNEANLKKAVDGFTAILDDIVKQTPNPTLKFAVQLARCYSNMDQHDKAAKQLAAIPDPKAGADAGLYKGARLMLVRELRMAQDPKDEKNTKVEEARKVLDEVLGTDAKPNWGKRDINALKENVMLLEAEKKYAQAALLANKLVKTLLPKVNTDNTAKENYLECYYHVTYSFYKHSQGLDDAAKKEKELKEAAHQIVELEKKWENWGSDTSKKRFEELLAKEAPLKERVDQLKSAGM